MLLHTWALGLHGHEGVAEVDGGAPWVPVQHPVHRGPRVMVPKGTGGDGAGLRGALHQFRQQGWAEKGGELKGDAKGWRARGRHHTS